MMRHKLACLALLLTPLVFFLGTVPAWGDDFSVTTVFDCVGPGACEQSSEHEEGLLNWDFKGWATINVQNTGTESWGDFHFEIFQVDAETIENVDFIVTTPYEPTSSQSGLTWAVDNSAVGATLDLFFYSDPVDAGEFATFSVYTDNTADQVSFFGTSYFPTPVPEPGTFALLLAGFIGLAACGKRG